MRVRNLAYRFATTFIVGSLLCSCIGEDMKCDDMTPSGGSDVEGYIAISVVLSDDLTPPNTRSFDVGTTVQDKGYFFNSGIKQESKLCEEPGANWLLGYDDSGSLIVRLPLTSIDGQSSEDKTGTSYTALCQVPSSSINLSLINNLRIIFNASGELQSALESGQEIDDLLLSQESAGSIDYLFRSGCNTMSSSMIVDGNSVKPAVTMDEIITYESPQEALENPCATVYVERLQSKYTVLFRTSTYSPYDLYFDSSVDNPGVWRFNRNTQYSEKAQNNLIVFNQAASRQVSYVTSYDLNTEDQPTVNRGTWKAGIVGWSINATEPSEYLFKNLGSNPSDFKDNNFTPTGYSSPIRNFWSLDANYYNGPESYPDQYRDAWDLSNHNAGSIKAYEKGNNSNYPLNYYSFNSLMRRNIREYSAENTYDPGYAFRNINNPIENRAQFRCGTHLLVGAQLLINGFDDADIYNPTTVDSKGLIIVGTENNNEKRVKSKYFMNNIYWAEDAYINYYVKQMGTHLDATTECKSDLTRNQTFIPNNVFRPATGETKFYVKEGNGYRLADNRDFKIKPVYIIGGDGWCQPIPDLDPSNQENTVLYVKQQSSWWQPDSYAQVSLEDYLKFTYGYPFYFAQYFNEGRMYYAYPIDTNVDRSDNLDFGMVVGDYGAVRNHWYHYRFTGISSVGVPVGDPNQPIIPNNEPAILGLRFEVVIIPWHVVEEDVKL